GTPVYDAIKVRQGITISGADAEFGRFFTFLSRKLLGGDDPDEVGLDTLAKVGIDVTKISDEQVESALSSDKPIIEFLSDVQIRKPALPTGRVLVDIQTATG